MSLIISIDGNIGSGKSTILKHLREQLIEIKITCLLMNQLVNGQK